MAVYIILYPLPWVESCSTQLQTSRWWLVCPVQCVCQARAQLQDTPSGSHQHQVLLLIAIIAAQWLSPVCRRAIEARHYEARLRSFLLFSWNRWIIDWRIWSSGRLCLVTAALRRWGSGNTAVIAIVTETKLDLFCLYSFLRMLWKLFYYSLATAKVSVSQPNPRQPLYKSWSLCGCQLFCIKIQSI